MIKLSKGQVAVLAVAAAPMAAVGVAGAVATYVNMNHVLHRGASALGLVAAGEGATLICALVALAVTLMGQHTPATVRAGMWLVPLGAAGVGLALAPSTSEAVVMAFTPLAMTAAGEGVAFVARRVVAYRTGVDIEQQRRSGLLLWHANRAANGRGLGRFLSKAAVWRLTRKFAETDSQLSVQLGEIQRFRISQGADGNLAAVLSGAEKTPVRPAVDPVKPVRYLAPIEQPKAATGPSSLGEAAKALADRDAVRFGTLDRMAEELAEVEQVVADDPSLKLLTTAEVAKLKGVEPSTVRSWSHRGKLEKQMVNGVPMYRQLDVMNLD